MGLTTRLVHVPSLNPSGFIIASPSNLQRLFLFHTLFVSLPNPFIVSLATVCVNVVSLLREVRDV